MNAALAPLFLATLLQAPTPAQHATSIVQVVPVYDEKADGKKDIDAAVARAQANNRRVLVVWGANWCGWCVKLHGLFEHDETLAKELLYEYDVVSVDVGRFDKHMELAQSLGAQLKTTGLPYLTVLDGQRKVLANQDTGALEAGDKHDPAKVLAFLTSQQAQHEKASEVRDRALAAAVAAKKKLLVTFDAPWCIWCKRFEAWLERPDVAPLVAKHLVVQKIDVERTLGGQELCDAYGGKGSGIPWFAILDASGKTLATSTDSGKNLGCPYDDTEIAAFKALLTKAVPDLAAEDMATLERALIAQREEIEKAKPAQKASAKAKADIVLIAKVVEDYAIMNNGRYPESIEQLVQENEFGERFLGRATVPKDPWGNPYQYEPPASGSRKYRVFSYGQDGVPGGAGDDADIDNVKIQGG
jgi:type II secretion system protein G